MSFFTEARIQLLNYYREADLHIQFSEVPYLIVIIAYQLFSMVESKRV